MAESGDEALEIFTCDLKTQRGEKYEPVKPAKAPKTLAEMSVADIIGVRVGEPVLEDMPTNATTSSGDKFRVTKKPFIPKITRKRTPRPKVETRPVTTREEDYEREELPVALGPATVHIGAARFPATVIKYAGTNTCVITEDEVVLNARDGSFEFITGMVRGRREIAVRRNVSGKWYTVGDNHRVTFSKRMYAPSTSIF